MNAASAVSAPETPNSPEVRDLEVRRVRYPKRYRLLQVVRVKNVTPHLVRVTLAGEDLAGFESASFDDHIKVFFPSPGMARPVLPRIGPDGTVQAAAEPRPLTRDFTPRRCDAAAGELDLEFALHETGPASDWARQARPGQYLGIGGPKGSMIIPSAFDWHFLIGDETALPAIARRLEELPSSTRVFALIEIGDADARLPLELEAGHFLTWCHRQGSEHGAALMQALRQTALPAGEGFVWAAGEYSFVRDVRTHLCGERGLDKRRIRASSYWRVGTLGAHEVFKD